MIAARQFLAEEMGLVPAGGDAAALARPVMDRAVERLRAYGQSAADPGIVRAQLGNAYWFGQHVAVDRAEATRWWTLAAEKGNVDARYRLGLAVRDTDPPRGLELLRAAAGHNHPTAMLEAGRMLRDGRGGAANPVDAHAWLSLAAERNVAGAAAERDAIERRLDSGQLTGARARMAELAPRR